MSRDTFLTWEPNRSRKDTTGSHGAITMGPETEVITIRELSEHLWVHRSKIIAFEEGSTIRL
jgi:hypothetical protein